MLVAGKDSVWTRGEQPRRTPAPPPNLAGQQMFLTVALMLPVRPMRSEMMELNVVGHKPNVDGLDDVTGFEFINLIDGTFIYTISDAPRISSCTMTALGRISLDCCERNQCGKHRRRRRIDVGTWASRLSAVIPTMFLDGR